MTQTFNAEYGGHGGAVIDMTTKSGSNQFHGSLWEFVSGCVARREELFRFGRQPDPTILVRNQFGAGIGGPLKRNRTFFFVNYEGFRAAQATTAIATVPDTLAPSRSAAIRCESRRPPQQHQPVWLCRHSDESSDKQPFLNLLPRLERT